MGRTDRPDLDSNQRPLGPRSRARHPLCHALAVPGDLEARSVRSLSGRLAPSGEDAAGQHVSAAGQHVSRLPNPRAARGTTKPTKRVTSAAEEGDAARANEYLLEYFADNPCVDCGEGIRSSWNSTTWGDKLFDIGREFEVRTWQSGLDDIDSAKLSARTAPRRRTALRRPSMRYLLTRESEESG